MKRRLTALFLCLIMCVLSVITLSGCKDKTFTVTFNRGGTKDMVVKMMEGKEYENIPEIQTVSHWSEIKFPVYICEGYTFSAWNQVISRIDKDTVITAQWTPNPFIVKFDSVHPKADYKSGKLEQTVHNWTEVVPPEYELEGYTVKWERDVRNTKDTTVYAEWIPNKYTLTFVDEQDVLYDFDPVEVTYDAPVGILPVPEKENKTFGGWFVKGNVSDYVMEGEIWQMPDNATLVSRWLEEDQYRIIYKNAFDIKGEVSYRSTDEDFVINPPSRKGYDFLGWTGTGIGDDPQKDVIIRKGTTGDLEFTAHWKAKTRSLVLDADGGQLNQNSSWTVTFGEKVGALPNEVVKDGYEFVGWEAENGAMIDSDTVWCWDPDEPKKITFIKAVYKRLYTIKLVLKRPSSKVVCTLSESVATEFGLEDMRETEDNVWVFKKTFKEGDRIGKLPDKVNFNNDEYSFSHWATSTGVKVNEADIVNETKFPGTRESGVIYIYVKLSYNWTPFY